MYWRGKITFSYSVCYFFMLFHIELVWTTFKLELRYWLNALGQDDPSEADNNKFILMLLLPLFNLKRTQNLTSSEIEEGYGGLSLIPVDLVCCHWTAYKGFRKKRNLEISQEIREVRASHRPCWLFFPVSAA